MTVPIDVLVDRDDRGLFDLTINDDGDFTTTQGFDSALVMSLGCERRADASEVLRPELRRGWWGNELNDDGFEIGSKLWLLDQARLTQETMNAAIDYTKRGLQWLIDGGHLDTVEVTGRFTNSGILLTINLERSNSITESVSYELWERTNGV